MAAKLATASVTVVASAVIWMFATFETASGSEAKWNQHNQAIACRTVYELQKEIRSYLKQLQLDNSLTAGERQWIEQEIKALQAEIARLDPRGNC